MVKSTPSLTLVCRSTPSWQACFSGMAVHAADSDLFFNQRPAARLLAGRRTGQAQDIGERQHFFDQACRFFHRTFGNEFKIARNIDVRGTVHLAWGLTIGIM